MRGEISTLRGMRAFREWAVRVATSRHNPDWVMPLKDKQNRETKLGVTLEAYNYYRTHSQQELPEIKDETVLSSMLEHENQHHIPRHHKFLRNLKLRLMPLRSMY